MKVAVLWTGLSGYLNACLKELAGREGVQLFVSYQVPHGSAPFDESQFAWIEDRLSWRTQCDFESLNRRVRAFAPDIIVLPSWHVPNYRRIASEYEGKTWRVMIMDNPWRGTLRQQLGIWISPFYVRSMTDVIWLPGERQAVFARKLGFAERRIFRGSFSCDQLKFEQKHLERVTFARPVPRSFLFAGRLVAAKGIDVLAKAYRLYRTDCSNPWPLACCGTGPLRSSLEGIPGVQIEGFVQPDQMPSRFAAAGCFVLPSRFEPWGLVIHEAVSAGLVVLASESVGAAVHLVQPNYNGYIFDSRDVEGLAGLLSRVSRASDIRLDSMSCASHTLSLQYSPRQWADTLLESFSTRNE